MTGYEPRPGEVERIVHRAARVRLWHAAAAGIAATFVAVTVVVPTVAGRPAGIEPARPLPVSGGATAPPSATRPAGAGPATAGPSGGPAGPGTAAPVPPGAAATGTPRPSASTSPPGLRCAAGANGGATDEPVTATSVELFTTVSRSGLPVFRHDPVPALMAEPERVNQAGGVCGRRLGLRVADDGGDVGRGVAQTRQALAEGVLAVPFVGAPDVLDALLDAGDLDRARTPVLLPTRDAAFYGRDWVWPVGVPDTTAARLMVRDAHRRGARTFGVVFDDPAAGAAFDAEVRRLTGRHVAGYAPGSGCERLYCGRRRGSGSASAFYAERPDFVGLLVDEQAALSWQHDPWTPPVSDVPQGVAGLDPLLHHAFRSQCKEKCDGLRVWSAYKARCGAYDDDAAVRQYEADFDGTQTDTTDRGVAATYATGQLLVAAVRATGPDLTRARLAHVLRTRPLRVGMTVAETLSFADGGNRTMRAYDLPYAGTAGRCMLGPVARG